MTQLGNVLVSGALGLVALVVIGGVLRTGWQFFEELLEVSLSMAVAVVPEGLPAVVTVTLAIGTQKMVRPQALIRKLPAVETLGSVTTICSDKTGTLTQNKMVVQKIETGSYHFNVTGEGYTPVGEFLCKQHDRIETELEVQQLLLACVLCNDALLQQQIQPKHQEWSILGDPTEGALLALAGKAGIFKEQLDSKMPRMGEFPFSSERKRMSVIVSNGDEEGSYSMFTKGSPELILERCDRILIQDRLVLFTTEQRQQILSKNDQMASNGLRVLGFAYKPLTNLPNAGDEAEIEQELVWLGLVGMLDAPRLEVKDAVKRCKSAGIRPVMITGDHQLTAMAIACELGIASPYEEVLTGQKLQAMSALDLEEVVDRVSVYARVSPEHKLRIVQALQKRGKFVAMTGDGVNEAVLVCFSGGREIARKTVIAGPFADEYKFADEVTVVDEKGEHDLNFSGGLCIIDRSSVAVKNHLNLSDRLSCYSGADKIIDFEVYGRETTIDEYLEGRSFLAKASGKAFNSDSLDRYLVFGGAACLGEET